MKFEKSFAAILILAMLIIIISPLGLATLSSNVNIQTSGTIWDSGDSEIVADSGSARDIQEAVNTAASLGITKVVIPEGTYDFVSAGESWVTVNVPDGISIFGAQTERTSGLGVPDQGMDPNDQVVEWRTVLRMPSQAPDQSTFFSVQYATGARISDLELVGYREMNPNSQTHYFGIKVRNCVDFRVDHCNLRNICGAGIEVERSRGVVDHNRLTNDPAYVTALFDECSVWYGVLVGGDGTWETNIQDVLGHYTSRTVFIENNYFEGWRHVVASNSGAHYVYRYNTERKNGYGTVDAHGHESSTSTRCIEVYNNDFGEPVWATFAVQLRGGGGVFFNNGVQGYGTEQSTFSSFLCMVQYTPDSYPAEQVKAVWCWNNILSPPSADLIDVNWGGIAENPIREDYDYFLRSPNQTLDGFTYIPYQYPHPLAT